MEVHHHPHVEKKRFKEYFLEFLMIFLAVTLGFFAENIREGISEKHTAKELAVSLYSDLKSDTEALNKIAVFRNKKEETMNHLLEILKQNPKKINASLFFQLIIPAFSTDDFSEKQSAGTITQLKNAGYLRYYTHTDIPATLARYESSVNSLFSMERLEEQERQKFIDHRFNKALVRRLTNLDGTNLDVFMLRYRPSYAFTLVAPEYDFQMYIKKCFELYSSLKSF